MATHGYILATWVKAIGRALDAAGCDGELALAATGDAASPRWRVSRSH